MNIKLIYIPYIKSEWQTIHKIKALEINGKAPIIDELSKWEKGSLAEFKKIIKVMRLVASNKRVRNENHVKRAKRYEDMFYMRAHKGSARVNFFYTKDDEEVVVCTSSYWKTKKSKAEQNRALKTAKDLKELFYSYYK
jgi:hypothetical protein